MASVRTAAAKKSKGMAYGLMGLPRCNWKLYIAVIVQKHFLHLIRELLGSTFTHSLKSGRRSPRDACAAVARNMAPTRAEALHLDVFRCLIVRCCLYCHRYKPKFTRGNSRRCPQRQGYTAPEGRVPDPPSVENSSSPFCRREASSFIHFFPSQRHTRITLVNFKKVLMK